MEGIVIGLLYYWLGYFKRLYLVGYGNGGDDSSSSEEANKFTVKVKKGKPPKNTGLTIDCYNVEMAGMISHPTDDQVKIILTIQDVLIMKMKMMRVHQSYQLMKHFQKRE